MDPFTMAELLIPGVELTPGQLAQLRALNTKYFTELYALRQTAEARRGTTADAAEPLAGRSPVTPGADLAALDAMIARDIRDMLTEEQQAVLDRNWPRLREQATERPVSDERAGSVPPRDR